MAIKVAAPAAQRAADQGSGRSQAAGYAAILVAAATFGASGIFIKYVTLHTGVNALALAFWRDLTTATVLLGGLALLRPRSLRINRRDLPRFIGLGISLGGFHVLWNTCVMLFGAAVATVQQAAMPALVVLAAWVLWKEPLTWRKMLGVFLAFAGIVLVTGPNELTKTSASGLAWLAAISLPVAYAAWNLFGKSLRGRYEAPTTFAYGFAFATVALLPFQFFTPQPTAVPLVGLLWFAGMICQTIIAFVTYSFGLGRLPAGIAGLLAMSEIVFVAFYAYFLLGERLVALQWAGVVLVVVGVLLPTLTRPGAAAADTVAKADV